jgi:uncharacterized membrane protein YfcA
MTISQSAQPIFTLANTKFRLFFVTAWLLLILGSPLLLSEFFDYSLFSLLGVLGAIFANATGAGGGVVFIPAFAELDFTEKQAIATSFAIQCFGMTAGSLTWWSHYQRDKTVSRSWQGFKRTIVLTSISAILGLWLVYGFGLESPTSLHQDFSWFSLVLGVFIVLTVVLIKPNHKQSQLHYYDYIVLFILGGLGGILTAWMSVGVGELLAIYLILRRFDISMAVAAAVIVSAITIWSGIAQHTVVGFSVYWQVVIFAGPGAILGGMMAKTLVNYLSATRLKLFFALWLLVIGVVGIKT